MVITKPRKVVKQKVKNTKKAQPKTRQRANPGSSGKGNFYRIIVRPKEEFISFRTQDIGKDGHIERVACSRITGTWDTQAWLISKEDAHLWGDRLIADSDDAQELLDTLESKPQHLKADIFKVKAK